MDTCLSDERIYHIVLTSTKYYTVQYSSTSAANLPLEYVPMELQVSVVFPLFHPVCLERRMSAKLQQRPRSASSIPRTMGYTIRRVRRGFGRKGAMQERMRLLATS
jgi:hypothetical protein